MSRRAVAVVYVLALLSGGALGQSPPPEPRIEAHTLEVGEITRRYRIALPEEPWGAPLLLALHDGASSGEALLATTDLAAAATARGWAVAFPSSGGVFWDAALTRTGRSSDVSAADDVSFLRALVADAAERFEIDAARVAAVGLGNGAAMVVEALCVAPGWLAGAVLVAGLPWDYQLAGCEARATSTLLVIGEDDPSYPIAGAALEGADPPTGTLALDASAAFLARVNGCNAVASPASGVASANNCDAPFGTVVVADAGHHWFSPSDPVNPSTLETSNVALDFLDGHDWQAAVRTPPAFSGAAGVPRSWFLYLPPSFDAADPPGLVTVLHGRPGSGPAMAIITDLNSVAEEAGFAVLYPESYLDTWNYTEGFPGRPQYPVSDVDFLRRLSVALSESVPLDPERSYVTGFSNGGFMTQRLACAATDTFAAFAFVGSSLPSEIAPVCDPAQVAPIMYMHGSEDVSVPWDGTAVPEGGGRTRLVSLPVPDTIRYWTTRNACVYYPARQAEPVDPATGTRVVRLRYEDCLLGSDVLVYVIEGGGHNWPGVPGRISEAIAGRVNRTIHAGWEVWRFFEPLRLDRSAATP